MARHTPVLLGKVQLFSPDLRLKNSDNICMFIVSEVSFVNGGRPVLIKQSRVRNGQTWGRTKELAFRASQTVTG